MFDSNAPGGTTATVDGTSATKSTKVALDTALTSDIIPADTAPTCSDSNCIFMGWTTDKDASVVEGKKNADLVGTTPTGSVTTYYAKWFSPTSGFWLSSTNTTGTQLSDFTGDTNYRSDKDIVEDMRIMHVGNTTANATAYSEATTRWNSYYSNDVKLYATYNGGSSEKMYDGSTTSALNGLVEFRILQVGAHDSDGSVVSFMATHVLPTAEQMNTSDTNVGGWNKTALRKKLQSGGEIYNKFPTALTSVIKKVNKLNHVGGASTSQYASGTTTNDSFWLISYGELYSKGTYYNSAPRCDGTTYQWCKDNEIDGDSAKNAVLAYKTRSSATPGSCLGSTCHWWQRSTVVSTQGSNFMRTNEDGGVYGTFIASVNIGVVPAFAF